MSEDTREIIFYNLNLKDTQELVEIWQTNDRVEWMDDTFDVIKDILLERLGELPPQNEPVWEHIEEDIEDGLETFLNDCEAKENQPIFYNPRRILQLDTWLSRVAVFAMIVAFLTQLGNFDEIRTTIQKIEFAGAVWFYMSWLTSILVCIGSALLESILIFFSCKALGAILKILMEMEFNSRGVK